VPLGVNMVMFWAKGLKLVEEFMVLFSAKGLKLVEEFMEMFWLEGLKLVEKAIMMERCCCRANGQSSQSRGFGETGKLMQGESKIEGAGKRLRGT
jgi:hypothetical protein